MTKFNKITVLGGGAFGVALAKLSVSKAKKILFWARDAHVVSTINSTHYHPYKLTNILLANNIIASTDLEYSLRDTEALMITLPLEAMTSVLLQARPYLPAATTIISTAKGISLENLLAYDIINNCLPKNLAQKACYISGPSFAGELAAGLPTALTLASFDPSSRQFQQDFSSSNFRLYWSDDVVGVCVGGALKNVIAIAAGMCAALGLGRNALAALITRGLAEMTRLAKKMGAQAETLSGLSGVGDLLLSCTDDMSRNHRLGSLIAQGLSLEKALAQIGSIVEGANTAQSIIALSTKFAVDMPISVAVYQVLYEGLSPTVLVSAFLERDPKEENN